MDTPTTVVILAAGLGTRMKSKRAKVLHEVGGKSLLAHVVASAQQIASPENIVVVVGYQAEEVRKAVPVPGLVFVHQAEQKGTGHALMVAAEELARREGLLLILYGDCPMIRAETLAGLVQAQSQADDQTAGTMLTALMEDPTGYGRVLRDSHGRVTGIVEQRAATSEQLQIREANMGLYCFRMDLFLNYLGKIRPDNPAREYYLTDVVQLLACAGYRIETVQVEDPREVLGINNRLELAAIDRYFRERKVTELMLDGVTIEKPETVTVDAEVRIGPDTVIEPFARILGGTRIGENCRIGSCSIIRDSELGDSVEVGAFTWINTSRLENNCRVGPYARLRMENHLAAGAQVGNFVELKKTVLGAGSKAQHLAYLGDATIGTGVNIGAGTITCNYDGQKKYPSCIADGAFVGSNSTLVAPLEIGPNSYIAAGSVITDPVPADALALGRERQVVKQDWARKRRERKFS